MTAVAFAIVFALALATGVAIGRVTAREIYAVFRRARGDPARRMPQAQRDRLRREVQRLEIERRSLDEECERLDARLKGGPMRQLPLERRVRSRGSAAALHLSVVRFSTGDETYAPGYYAAPWWIAWLWRIVPRQWCWRPPGGERAGWERAGWVAPGIGGVTWHLGVVRKSQCLDPPPYRTYFVAWCNGREFTIPRWEWAP